MIVESPNIKWKIASITVFNDLKYFIYGYINNNCKYMHRNGNIHSLCGIEGFFDSYEHAKSYIQIIKTLKPQIFKKFTDELFRIE